MERLFYTSIQKHIDLYTKNVLNKPFLNNSHSIYVAKHLEKIASKILNNDEKFSKLKEKETSLKFLKLF